MECGKVKSVYSSLLIIVSFAFSSCFSGTPHYISQREPVAPVAPIQEISKSEPDNKKPLDLFVRQKDFKIRRKAPANETGSLTDLNDPRAYLFGFERPVEVGMFIDVKVASNRSDSSGSNVTPTEPAAIAKGKDNESKDGAVKDVSAEDLLKALPSLDPAPENKPILLKSIKMQVMERFDNGDVLVLHQRRSIREGQGAEVAVTARVPAEALARADNISTLDLSDVAWRESFNGDIAERNSANWEDEYSLRLSGFDETKSKDALGLEEKRQQLKTARDKLETEMKGLAGERSRISNERSKLLQEKEQDSAKISDLEKKNTDLQKKVEELTQQQQAKLAEDNKKAENKEADAKKSADKSKETPAQGKNPGKPASADTKKDAAKPSDDKKKG